MEIVTTIQIAAMRRMLVDELRISYSRTRRMLKEVTGGFHRRNQLMIPAGVFNYCSFLLHEAFGLAR
jgi:hypothetical protein